MLKIFCSCCCLEIYLCMLQTGMQLCSYAVLEYNIVQCWKHVVSHPATLITRRVLVKMEKTGQDALQIHFKILLISKLRVTSP